MMVRGRLSRELRAVFRVRRQAIMPRNALDTPHRRIKIVRVGAYERLPRLSGYTASRNTDAEFGSLDKHRMLNAEMEQAVEMHSPGVKRVDLQSAAWDCATGVKPYNPMRCCASGLITNRANRNAASRCPNTDRP